MKLRRLISENIPFFLGVPALVWQVFFLYVPILIICVVGFGPFSMAFIAPFVSWLYACVLFRSFALALSTALICLVVAYPVAYWLAMHQGRLRGILLFMLFIPFWTNFLLHVYAWMFLLDRQGVVNVVLQWLGLINEPLHILNSVFATLILMVYCYMPFMILPLYSALEKFDIGLQEASFDLGATWWQTLWCVVVPMSMPGIRTGFFLVFVPAFGEFVIPELVGGDKVMYVGSVIAHLVLQAKTAALGAGFTLFSSVILVIILAGLYLLFGRMNAPSHTSHE